MTLNELVDWLSDVRLLLILGIGNLLRRDDAVGVYVVDELEGKVPSWVKLIRCEAVPENYLGVIKRLNPSHVLLVDAAHLGEAPGAYRLVPPEWVVGETLSTHRLPLYITAEYIRRETGAKVAILAIQPASIDFGEGLTSEVKRSVSKIVAVLLEAINRAGSTRR
ncbi:hydrogenase 3 maturation endopeptidase HyCI [Candidatus Bathyarchaeota archaeon]|nr:MAG: hydrogenase 3 maturation endopeptidase HyCI [Candidatus Bathyarchaeota archaeon]